MPDRTDFRLLVFVVAYNASATLLKVLERIPWDRIEWETEVLIIDDHSQDETFETGLELRDAFPEYPIRVLRTPLNQGYGGNQKLGYRYAIDHGFDAVALLHGDGQYPPEMLPDLVRPIAELRAEAVFGSRMMERGKAREGGMPLYKYVGNRILTVFQNKTLGMDLSEFHSGFRAYATRALAEIPFAYNTNDFHFDTDIIIQLHRHRSRILEIPIPTYYGDEICYVNGMAYAWNVFRSTLGSRLQQLGILSRRKFEAPPTENVYQLKDDYASSHTYALEAIEPGAKVLDLGCGIGLVAERLVRDKGCHVTGVDLPPATDEEVGRRLQRFVREDLEAAGLMKKLEDDYDTVVLLDVIEHLGDPSGFLDRLRRKLGSRRPRVVLTTPNVGFFLVRFSLLLGQFNYGERGILDRTHTKLFTFRSLRELLEESGYVVLETRGIPAPFPLAMGRGWLARALVRLNSFLIRLLPGLFSYQIYAETEMVPTVEALLDATVETSRRAERAWYEQRETTTRPGRVVAT